MTKLAVLLVFCSLLSLLYSQNPDFDQKFCDKNIPQSKIQEFEKCEQFVPKEILDNSAKCLQQLRLGSRYADFRNAVCNTNTRKKYLNCHKNQMRQQKSNGQPQEMSEDQVENFRKHENCMRKAMGVDTDQ